jgi:3-hydroxyacyl-CoA dehydrogenase
VATELAFVLSGGTTDQTAGISEEQLSALEREAMLRLMHDEKTLARMEHILDTGKPLRN